MSDPLGTPLLMKHAHSVVEVAGLLGLTPEATRQLIETVFGGPRDVVSFQDLVLLRTARKVPKARIAEALSRVRNELGADQPLSSVTLQKVGKELVVNVGAAKWNASSGQQLLDLDRSPGSRGQLAAASAHARCRRPLRQRRAARRDRSHRGARGLRRRGRRRSPPRRCPREPGPAAALARAAARGRGPLRGRPGLAAHRRHRVLQPGRGARGSGALRRRHRPLPGDPGARPQRHRRVLQPRRSLREEGREDGRLPQPEGLPPRLSSPR